MDTRNLITGLVAAPLLLSAATAIPAMAQGVTATQALEINADLDALASQTAGALSNPALRKFLLEETLASRNEEQILVFQDTLQKAQGRSDVGLPPGLVQRLIGLANHTEDRIATTMKPEIAGINVYFPVDSHRKSWRGDGDLLVAYDPIGDEDEIAAIVAYSVETGRQVILDAHAAPETPTLVIAPKEYDGRGIKEGALAVPEPGPRTEDGNELGLSATAGYFYIGIPQVYMHNDHEPWYRGDPEIYVLVGQSYKTSPIESIIHLPGVNKEKQWYWLGDGPGSPLYFFFTEEDYSDLTYFHFMESDGGGKFTISASVEYKGAKVGLEYVVEDGDDNLGKRYIHKSQLPLGGYLRQSTGDMDFDADKDGA